MTSEEWKKWRHLGLGGSDSPIVMGDSEFMTPLELFEQKILPEPPEESSNFVTDRGNEFEPKIRDLYNMLVDKNYEPALRVMADFPFMRCSLDGLDGDQIIEIKTAGKADHAGVKQGIVPKKYRAQIQHCLMVSGAKRCIYLSYNDPEWNKSVNIENLAIISVEPDPEYQAQILAACDQFWNQHVMKKKPPTLSQDDYAMLKGQARLLNKWKKLKIQADAIDEQLEAARQAVIDEAAKQGHGRYLSNGVRIRQESRVGNVNYKSIPELKGVDLEQYRGKGSTSWKIEIVEEKT
jgi:putative phage-type endonuclease